MADNKEDNNLSNGQETPENGSPEPAISSTTPEGPAGEPQLPTVEPTPAEQAPAADDNAEPAEAETSPPEAPAKQGKKSSVTNILIVGAVALIFTIGLIIMLYPQISNYVNQKNQSRVVAGYREAVSALDPVDYSVYLEAAHAYNARLAQAGTTVYDAFSFAGTGVQDRSDEYWNLLRVGDGRIMGYVVIDILDIEVPLYHGTGDIELAIGAGHMQGTSLPVGGVSTHAAVSAHTGLPSAKFFDGVDRLKEGDTFQFHVLNEILTYQVDQVLIVLPEEVDDLAIVEGQDYATLVTCTPYGINSHRLLVRGTRIETPPEQLAAIEDVLVVTEEPGFFAKVGNAIVVGLSTFVEAVAGLVVSIAEWGMDIFDVPY